MSLTKEEREAKVREYYDQLAEDGIEVPENEIQEAIDWTEGEELQEKAREMLSWRSDVNEATNHLLHDQDEVKPFRDPGRILEPKINWKKTPEAEQENLEFLRSISTEEGYKKFLKDQILLAYHFNLEEMRSFNMQNAGQKLSDPVFREKVSSLMLVRDFMTQAEEMGVEGLPEDCKQTCDVKCDTITTLYMQFPNYLKAMASDQGAFIKTDGKTLQKALNNPDDILGTSDASDYLRDASDLVSDQAKDVVYGSFRSVDFLTAHNLPVNFDNMNALVSRSPLREPASPENGVPRDRIHMMGEGGKTVSWDAHYTLDAVQKDAEPDAMLRDLKETRKLLNETMRKGDGSTELFRTMMTDLDNVIKAREAFGPGIHSKKEEVENSVLQSNLSDKLDQSVNDYLRYKKGQVFSKMSDRGSKRLELATRLNEQNKVFQRGIGDERREVEASLSQSEAVLAGYAPKNGKTRIMRQDGSALKPADNARWFMPMADELMGRGKAGNGKFYLLDENNPGKAREISMDEQGSILVQDKTIDVYGGENQTQTLKALNDVYKDLKELGTSRGDSAEYKEMMLKCGEAINTLKTNVEKNQVTHALEELNKAADSYYFAKLDQSMNTRRAGRVMDAAKLKNICTASLSGDVKARMSDTDLSKEIILDKGVKSVAMQGIAKSKNQVFKDTCRAALNSREGFRAAVENARRSESYRSLLEKQPGEQDKNYEKRLNAMMKVSGSNIAAAICKKGPGLSREANANQNRPENPEKHIEAIQPRGLNH